MDQDFRFERYDRLSFVLAGVVVVLQVLLGLWAGFRAFEDWRDGSVPSALLLTILAALLLKRFVRTILWRLGIQLQPKWRLRKLLARVMHHVRPESPLWMGMLGRSYERELRWLAENSPERTAAAEQAHFWLARRMEAKIKRSPHTSGEFLRSLYSQNLASLAYEAGRLEEAEKYALESMKQQELLREVGAYGGHPPDEESLTAHTILGLVAMKRNDVDVAEEHLLMATQVTEAQPHERSFGPDFRLARELFRRGRTESVIAFLEACRRLWTTGRGQQALARWLTAARRGEDPWADESPLPPYGPYKTQADA